MEYKQRKGQILVDLLDTLRPDLEGDPKKGGTGHNYADLCGLLLDASQIGAILTDPANGSKIDSEWFRSRSSSYEAALLLKAIAPLKQDFDVLEYLRDWKSFTEAPIQSEKLRCPACGKPLFVTGYARLESLDEHVCSPNETPSLKRTYGCLNTAECKAAQEDVMWSGDGEFYGPKDRNRQYPFGKAEEYYGFKDGNDGPYGTFWRGQRVQELHKKERRFYPLMLLWPTRYLTMYLLWPFWFVVWIFRNPEVRGFDAFCFDFLSKLHLQVTKDLKRFCLILTSTPFGDDNGLITRWSRHFSMTWDSITIYTPWRRFFWKLRDFRMNYFGFLRTGKTQSFYSDRLKNLFFGTDSYWAKPSKIEKTSRWIFCHLFPFTAKKLKSLSA